MLEDDQMTRLPLAVNSLPSGTVPFSDSIAFMHPSLECNLVICRARAYKQGHNIHLVWTSHVEELYTYRVIIERAR